MHLSRRNADHNRPFISWILQGIVNAVRELGGRFLELDERTQVYYDIGDKKATEKVWILLLDFDFPFSTEI